MNPPTCLACRERPSVTITGDVYTPLCDECLDRIGTPIAIGGRAVCHIGSIIGGVAQFDDSSWNDSSLAEIVCDDGGTAWCPLAELAPAK